MASNGASIQQHLETFIKHVEELRQTDDDEVDGFEKEYKKIRDESILCKAQNRYPATEAQKEGNLKKNRFKDITPYDYTRVTLEEKEGVPGSDYINANFIKGVNGEATYIASQGPLPHTTTDFWRMLWQYETKVVIMVCREVEMDKPRCQRYWPNEGETMEFDGISVILIEEQHPDPDDQFVFRELRAVRGETTRVIHHLHFLAWPDRFVPSEYAHVIDLLAKARDLQTADKPPVVVHCSAGCGRTGSLVVVDYVWNLLKANKITTDFSLFDIIKTMRTQRPSFVQSEEQYYFVHKAIEFLFKEHLKLLDDHFSDNEVYVNVTDGTIAYAGASALSLSIIQSTVQKLLGSQKKEPTPAPRRLASDSAEKPVIPGKPNIPGKPSISRKPESSTKTSGKQEKLIEPYEEVFVAPRAVGTNQKTKRLIEPYEEVFVAPRAAGTNQKTERLIEPYEEVTVKLTGSGVKPTLTVSDSDKERLLRRPAVAVPNADESEYADVDVIAAAAAADRNNDYCYTGSAPADANEEEQNGEYTYADPMRTDKWSLQHIALKGVTSGATADVVSNSSSFEPSKDYPSSDDSYDSEGPAIPPKVESGFAKVSQVLGTSSSGGSGGQKGRTESRETSDREAKHRDRRHHHCTHRHKRSKSPHSNKRLPTPMSPSSSPANPQPVLTWVFDKKIMYQGIDISFPNRLGKKPVGPRKMAAKR